MVEQTRSAGRKEPSIAWPRVNEGKVPNGDPMVRQLEGHINSNRFAFACFVFVLFPQTLGNPVEYNHVQ